MYLERIEAMNIKNARKIFGDYSSWIGYGFAVLGIHLIGVALLLLGAREHPEMLGMGLISYSLGLRHAFDADHITAIDNMVRKMVQQRENPKGVGFFFSFGHSTVVVLMSVIAIFTVRLAQQRFPQLHELGGIVALTVSGGFLFLIGLINLFIWIDIYKTFISMRHGTYKEDTGHTLPGGILKRGISFIYGFVNKSWQVYLLGFVFGLGFDTASQVAMLTTSAGAASQTIPSFAILSFPILFTAGMSLMDTADGLFMTTAYEWVFSTPIRKIYYNLTITGLSVIAALLIGSVELIQVIVPKLGLNYGAWIWLQNLNFNTLGFMLVALFLLVWAISYGGWKLLGIGEQ